MLRSNRVYLALALVTTVTVGCGGGGNTVGSGGSGGQGSTSSSSAASSSSSAASSSSGLTCMAGEGTVLAGTKLLFGDGNSGQWKKFGFNLDGKVSTGSSKDVCQPNAGGMAGTAYPDGDLGIDNSFGKNLLPQIIAFYPTWVTDTNNSIQNGNFNVLLKLECLPPTGDVPVLTTKLFGGTSLGMMPKFDGMDKWPSEPELLSDPMDPLSSTIVFNKSSVIGTMFDSGKNETFLLTVPLKTVTKSTSIKLSLYAAQTTMILAADRKSATGGMIGGVLNTEEFVAEVKKLGELFGYCNSPLFTNLVTQIRQASDIMADGSQDPAKTCDGISMGLGFEMSEAQIDGVGPVTPVGLACP
jgi:hypothetical protein